MPLLTVVWQKLKLLESMDINEYSALEERGKHLYTFDAVVILALVKGVDSFFVDINEENFNSIFKLPTPVFIDAVQKDKSISGFADSENNSDSDNESQKKRQDLLEKTANTLDLSMMNESTVRSGDRWSEEEEMYLLNFHRYVLIKEITKPGVENLMKWILKRKSSKEQLFGMRNLTAVLARYSKMKKDGIFKYVKKPKTKSK